LPRSCDAILLKALAKDPAKRHQSGREMAEDLKAAAEGRAPACVAPAGEGTVVAEADVAPEEVHAERLAEVERKAAAMGSAAARAVVKAAGAAEAGARAVGRSAAAGIKVSSPVVARWLRAALAGAKRGVRAARAAWARGWAKGPRARAAMIAGTIVLLLALIFGGYAAVSQIIESRRETPTRKMKKAFKNLFSDLGDLRRLPPNEEGESRG